MAIRILDYEIGVTKVNKDPKVEVVDKDGNPVNKPTLVEKILNAAVTGLKIVTVGGLAVGAAYLNGKRVGKEKDKEIRKFKDAYEDALGERDYYYNQLNSQEEETVDESEADEAEDIEE